MVDCIVKVSRAAASFQHNRRRYNAVVSGWKFEADIIYQEPGWEDEAPFCIKYYKPSTHSNKLWGLKVPRNKSHYVALERQFNVPPFMCELEVVFRRE